MLTSFHYNILNKMPKKLQYVGFPNVNAILHDSYLECYLSLIIFLTAMVTQTKKVMISQTVKHVLKLK